MRVFRFLLLMSIVVVTFGPATAQDVFIKRSKGENTDRKPTLYINRGGYDGRVAKPRARMASIPSRHNDKLKLARDTRNVGEMADVFYAWQASGRTPRTQEEISSYADSKRAVIEKSILQDRKELIARLEKDDRERAKRYARAVSFERNTAGDSRQSSHAVSGAVQKSGRVIIKKPTVYRKGNNSNSSGSGVFKNYR